MECEEFLADYSDFLDLQFVEHDPDSYSEHLQNCGSCSEYDRVMRRGLEIVRELAPPAACPDIMPLVRSRVLGPPGLADGSSAGATRGLATALAAIALVLVGVLAGVASRGGTVVLPSVVVEPAANDEPPSLWGPAPQFKPSLSLVEIPGLSNDRLFAPTRERHSLFRAPPRAGAVEPRRSEQAAVE